ncbi:MAG: SirB2 family protein [Steroidobacteraceae bacterium]
MTELYPTIKLLHIAAVAVSGGLFFIRGLGRAADAPWAMAAPMRYASYAIDTVLLGAAIALSVIIHQYPFVHGWLTAKVVLLVVYIALGTFALKRGRTRTIRVVCWLAALAVFALILSIARHHDALGPLSSS